MESASGARRSFRRVVSGSSGLAHGLLTSRLATALTYPHPIDHYLERVSPLWSLQRIRAVVVEVVRETPDVATLVLRPNGNFPNYEAGQYVATTVEVGGVQHTRCFSLSSSPLRTDGLITLTVKARARGGVVSPYLVAHARPGLRLVLSAPQGDFVLPDRLPGRLLFISGGSGITPCMAMLRTLLARGYAGELVFLHYARSPEDVIFGRELRALSVRHANLRLMVESGSERGTPPTLSAQVLSALAPGFEDWDAWVCGPASLLDAAVTLYRERKAEARLRTERFVLASSEASAQTGVLELAKSGRRLDQDGRTLLNQVEAAGVDAPRGCGMGICMSCRCKKLKGVTKNVQTGALSEADHEEIQLCIHVPVGDVTLEL